jgi:hypothetical protein
MTLCKEIQENIMDALDLQDLSMFANVNPMIHTGVDEYIQRRRRLILAWFVNKTNHFIKLMQTTRTVLSGSCALNIIQSREGAVEINDLDVYTTLQEFETVLQFFTEDEHYKVIGNFHCPPAGPYNHTGIAKLLRLYKNGTNMDIIVTNLTLAVAPIFQFHNTIVMNFISAEAIFCAYPAWTLNMVRLVHPRMYKQNCTNLAMVKALVKYMERGFNIYSNITELAPHQSCCKESYFCRHGKGLFT